MGGPLAQLDCLVPPHRVLDLTTTIDRREVKQVLIFCFMKLLVQYCLARGNYKNSRTGMESVSQLHYLVKRALTYLIVFVVVLNLIFILPRLVPGNAAEILASSTYVPANAVKEISARLGLDQPIGLQYTTYLKNIFLVWPPYFGV